MIISLKPMFFPTQLNIYTAICHSCNLNKNKNSPKAVNIIMVSPK